MKKVLFFPVFIFIIMVVFCLNFCYHERKSNYQKIGFNHYFQEVENNNHYIKKDKDCLNKMLVNTKISKDISPAKYVLCRNENDK